MPEGPEVKRICEDLNYNYKNKILTNIYFIGGRYVKENKDFLPKNYLNLISTLPLLIYEIECKGKLIIIQLIDDSFINNIACNDSGNNNLGNTKIRYYVFINLGMTGAFDLKYTKHSHIVFEFKEENILLVGKYLYYSDTRRFGTIHFTSEQKEYDNKIYNLAGEFLGNNIISFKQFYYNIKNCNNKTYLVKALMDQKSICCGIGNYSLSEILHHAEIKNIDIKCSELSDEMIKKLYESCQYILNLSYKYCGATMKDYHRLDGSKGKFSKLFKVYEKGNKQLGKHGRSIYI